MKMFKPSQLISEYPLPKEQDILDFIQASVNAAATDHVTRPQSERFVQQDNSRVEATNNKIKRHVSTAKTTNQAENNESKGQAILLVRKSQNTSVGTKTTSSRATINVKYHN
jgi:hypothetical protein